MLRFSTLPRHAAEYEPRAIIVLSSQREPELCCCSSTSRCCQMGLRGHANDISDVYAACSRPSLFGSANDSPAAALSQPQFRISVSPGRLPVPNVALLLYSNHSSARQKYAHLTSNTFQILIQLHKHFPLFRN